MNDKVTDEERAYANGKVVSLELDKSANEVRARGDASPYFNPPVSTLSYRWYPSPRPRPPVPVLGDRS